MPTSISIDLEQLAEDIALIKNEIAQMQGSYEQMYEYHFAEFKYGWKSTAATTLQERYEEAFRQIKASLEVYSKFAVFLDNVAKQYGITEKVNNLGQKYSQGSSAFEG